MDIKIAGKVAHSFVNGPGIRYVLFFQGCPHHCPGCQNPETHDVSGGETTTTEAILADIKSTKFLDGVTFSGGDPLMQPDALLELSKAVHDMGLNVWVYTGYTYEALKEKGLLKALAYVDVLVDGPFIMDLRSEETIWRGSSNQRLVNVQKSLRQDKLILYQK